jgi:hypothetical protein
MKSSRQAHRTHIPPCSNKGSDEDAEGLQKEILLAEGAKIMITRNVWTSKGVCQVYSTSLIDFLDLVSDFQGIVKNICYLPGSDVRINLPSVVCVQCNRYSGVY